MSYNTHASIAGWDQAIDALLALLSGGTIVFYDGSQPATPDIPVTTQQVLATLHIASPAFAAASNGSAIASATAALSGTATWARAFASGGAAVLDGAVGTSDSDFVVNSTAFIEGGTVTLTSWSVNCASGQ